MIRHALCFKLSSLLVDAVTIASRTEPFALSPLHGSCLPSRLVHCSMNLATSNLQHCFALFQHESYFLYLFDTRQPFPPHYSTCVEIESLSTAHHLFRRYHSASCASSNIHLCNDCLASKRCPHNQHTSEIMDARVSVLDVLKSPFPLLDLLSSQFTFCEVLTVLAEDSPANFTLAATTSYAHSARFER